jgi:hypothetical protein
VVGLRLFLGATSEGRKGSGCGIIIGFCSRHGRCGRAKETGLKTSDKSESTVFC